MYLGRVAITGGIGEGKSTVLRYLREAGYTVASADAVARQCMRDHQLRAEIAALAKLPKEFSSAELRDRLLTDDSARRAINAALHPRIIKGLQKKSADFIEVPLLIETALQGSFDAVWVVTCGPAEQRNRLVQRTKDIALTERLLAIQLPTSSKLPFADVIVRTNASRKRVKAYTLEAAAQAKDAWVANRVK